MSLVDIRTVFPGDWEELVNEVARRYRHRFTASEKLPPVDISHLDIPRTVLEEIRSNNKAKLYDLTLLPNPFSLEALQRPIAFDEQLCELLCDTSESYHPEEFVAQLAEMIHRFLNRSAAFRAGLVLDRVTPDNAGPSVSAIKQAWEGTEDEDEKYLLELLATDFTYAGRETWVGALKQPLKSFVAEAVVRNT